MRLLSLLALWLAVVPLAQAHEVRPAYLEIRQVSAETLQVRLRQPIVSLEQDRMGGLNLRPDFAAPCALSPEGLPRRSDGYLTEVFQAVCEGGVNGVEVRIEGLRQSLTDIYVRVTDAHGDQQGFLLNGRDPGFRLGKAAPLPALAFLSLGLRHLLGGLDHILFVIGLILLVPHVARLITVATTFTLAHSLTLGLSVLGLVHLPSGPVEAGIALSVLFMAYELSRPHDAQSRIARQYPELIAFGFGLLHGFGFAGGLVDTGMPGSAVVPALLFFNLGVEAGQILVILAVLLALLIAGALHPRGRGAVQAGLGALLTIGASYFFVGAGVALV